MIAFNGKIHWGFAILLYFMIANGNEQFYHYINPVWVFVGALLPDCDHKHAPAGKFLPLWLIFKHRTFTHTLWGMILFSGLLAIWHVNWGVSLAFGYATHLMLDACTPMGIHFFGRKKPAVKRVSRR